jgi:hypothetical protein
MAGSYDCEVPAIERRKPRDPKALGCSDDGGVHRSKRQVAVLPDELADAQPVARMYGLDGKRAARDIANEPDLSLLADAARKQVRDLRDRQGGHDQRPRMRLEQLTTRVVMSVVGVDVSVERP